MDGDLKTVSVIVSNHEDSEILPGAWTTTNALSTIAIGACRSKISLTAVTFAASHKCMASSTRDAEFSSVIVPRSASVLLIGKR